MNRLSRRMTDEINRVTKLSENQLRDLKRGLRDQSARVAELEKLLTDKDKQLEVVSI